MVVLLEAEGDPGENAADPGADGWSEGFVLANGQYDEYPDEDTVPVGAALGIIGHIVATGDWPADAPRVIDR